MNSYEYDKKCVNALRAFLYGYGPLFGKDDETSETNSVSLEGACDELTASFSSEFNSNENF